MKFVKEEKLELHLTDEERHSIIVAQNLFAKLHNEIVGKGYDVSKLSECADFLIELGASVDRKANIYALFDRKDNSNE